MMRKVRKTEAAKAGPTFVVFSTDRQIILLDQEPLREEASRAARKTISEIAKLSSSLEEFDKTILPAYSRWESETFGALLEEEAKLYAKIARLECLMQDVAMESFFTGQHPGDIYAEAQRAMEEWETEQATAHNDQAHSCNKESNDPDSGREFSDEEREFRAYMRFAEDEEPDDFTKREYKKRFNEYREWKRERESQAASVAQKKQDAPARVKELYRILVRRLHPDTGKGSSDPHSRRLWDDLQSAYAAMDVERLEVLLALTDLHERGPAIRSTLFHLRKVAKEMGRTVRELKSRLRDARSSPAWSFWHSEDREKTAAKLRSAINQRIGDAKKRIAAIEEEIDYFKNQSSRSKRKLGKSSPSRKSKPDSSGQGFFDF